MVAKQGENRLWCQVCGHSRADDEARAILRDYLNAGGKDYYSTDLIPDVEGGVNATHTQALLHEAWEHYQAGKNRSARLICREILRTDHRNTDAYYILYHAAPTPLEKARHLASVVAIQPNHKEAQQELDRLSKTLNVEIKPSFSTVYDHREVIDEDVVATAELEDCPMCAGRTLYVEEDYVKCLSCGYAPKAGGRGEARLQEDAPLAQTLPPDGGFHSLREALMERQYGSGREWIIARRVLACQNCGSQMTLSGNMMVDQCAFCDSQHVLVQDALGAFQEPDAILPADLNEREVVKTVVHMLSPEVQRAVYHYETVGVYLPFWNFRDRQNPHLWNTSPMLIAGGRQPSPAALEDIEPFDLRYLRPYDQRYLASWSAELYTRDVIQASLEVGAMLGDRLEYRLLLLPVWLTTIHLRGGKYFHGRMRDGGYLHSLVNAQTGEVVVADRVDAGSAYQSKLDRIKLSARGVQRPKESVIRPLPPRKK
jgi:hypothetical protein